MQGRATILELGRLDRATERKGEVMRVIRSLLLAVALAVVAGGTVSATSSPFTGSWESIDFDGSYQVMSISGFSSDGRARIALFDSFGTICVNVGASSTTFHGLADAWAEGDEIAFVWRHVGCGNIEVFYELGGGTFAYDDATDTVSDAGGLIWTRIAGHG
jgi:hypothetical protein